MRDTVRRPGGLATSANRAAPAGRRPELKDVFFFPGQPLGRRIFQRGADERISGYINRSNGQDVWVARR